MRTQTRSNGRTGRPRGFDEDEALEAAMRVFWEKSYEGATLADLTEAMGINRSSMFAAFGNKEALFKLAVSRYANGPMRYLREAMQQPTFRGAVEAALRGTVEFLSNPGNPRGCLSIQGALACGTDAEPVKEAMIEWRKRGEANLTKRVQQAQADGELDRSINAASYARFLTTIVNGLGIHAVNGATKPELNGIVEINLKLMGY